MNKKNLIIAAIVIVAVAGGSFYGGTTYAKSQTPARGQFAAGQFTGGTAGAARTGGGAGFGGTTGQIISKDASGITVQTQDGSSKIVLIGSNAQILKTSAGTSADLTTGTTVSVTGPANSDGSITAQSVQIRPAGATPPRPASTQ